MEQECQDTDTLGQKVFIFKHTHTHAHTHGQKVFVFSLSVHHLNSQHCNSQCTETCASPGRKCSFFPSGKVFPLKLFIIRPKSFPSPQDSTDKPERVHTGKEENCVCVFTRVWLRTNCTFPDFVDFVQAEKYTCCFSQYIPKNSLSHTHTHAQAHAHAHGLLVAWLLSTWLPPHHSGRPT